MGSSGIPGRPEVYVTNAVKHFKWTERGKRRIHQRPNGTEVKALGSWHGLAVSTIHPSAILRAPDAEGRDQAYAGLVADLVTARRSAAAQVPPRET